MFMFCGGQCGGIGDFLVAGLTLMGIYLLKIKHSISKIKDKFIGEKL